MKNYRLEKIICKPDIQHKTNVKSLESIPKTQQ